MKVFNHGGNGRGTIIVAPGKDHPETSDWIKVGRDALGRETREPVQIAVKFENGCADVPDNLGRYIIDQGLARKSRLIVPEKRVAATNAPPRRGPIAVGRELNEVLQR